MIKDYLISEKSVEAILADKYDHADWKYEKIKEQVNKFQVDLSNDEDVCVSLACFGSNIVMQVNEIGFQNPDLLYFYGYINGEKAQLIQHTSQLNFLLVAVKKSDPNSAPRRIGFV